jgi:hypothetical protein
MQAQRARGTAIPQRLVGPLLLACLSLSVACGGSEFSAGDDPAAGAGAESGDSGSGSGGSMSGGSTSGDSGSGSGGSGSPSGGRDGGGGSSSASTSCENYVEAVCDWEERCGEGFTGSREACLRVYAGSCEWYVELPGVNVGTSDFTACAASYAATECNEAVPECEFPTGSIGNGLPCASYVQCESGYCTGSSGACGVCAPNPYGEAGADCTSHSQCTTNLDCFEGQCTPKSEEGGPCGSNRGCSIAVRESGALVCIDETCQVVGLLGDPCHEASGAMICGAGTACSGETCVPLVLAEEGEPCGVFEDEVVDCKGGICWTQDLDTGVVECVTWAGPAEPCDKVRGFERCATGLTCDANNLCVFPTVPPPPEDCE